VSVRLVCVGLNHRRAPVELREKVAFAAERIEAALQELVELEDVEEALVLSTCNRVEIYAAGVTERVPFRVGSFLERFHGLDEGALEEHLFRLVGEDALSHLFRVSSSLDAIVVGEPQILGQVKDAFFKAAGAGTTGSVLNRSFHRAFSVAKRVRTETGIASSAVSVSYAGVELARKIFGALSGLDCLLVGAGDMGELAARHFVERGANLIVVNRSFDRAHRLASTYGGVAREISELPRLLEQVDIVLCSTSAPGFVVTKEMMKRALKGRRFRPIFLIDIAVPRDIDPAVSELEAVYAYDVDDLAQVVQENLESRRTEAERAEELVRNEVLSFSKRSRELRAVPAIKALRDRFLAVARAESEKTVANLGGEVSEKQRKTVEKMAEAIVNKVLHVPIGRLKESSIRGGDLEGVDLLAAARVLFDLEATPEDEAATDPAEVMTAAQEAEDAFDQDAAESAVEQRLAAIGQR